MKLYAKLELANGDNSVELLRIFFKVAKESDSFFVHGKDIIIEMEVLKSTEIFEVMSKCNIKKMYIAAEEGENLEINVGELTNSANRSESKNSAKNFSDFKAEIVRTKKEETGVEEDNLLISQLKEIAERTNSFDEFVDSIIKWIGIERKREEYFKTIVKRATETDKIKWRNLEDAVNSTNKVKCDKAVKEKIGNTYTLLNLIREIVKFKTYFDEKIKDKEKGESELDNINAGTSVADVSNVEFKLKNSRTIKPNKDGILDIPDLRKIFEEIDLSLTISERINYVLNSMGIDKKSDRDICVITDAVNVALRMKDISLIKVFSKISEQVSMLTGEMILSSFINEYVKRYKHKPVKALDFLKDLQSVIMKEDEITD